MAILAIDAIGDVGGAVFIFDALADDGSRCALLTVDLIEKVGVRRRRRSVDDRRGRVRRTPVRHRSGGLIATTGCAPRG